MGGSESFIRYIILFLIVLIPLMYIGWNNDEPFRANSLDNPQWDYDILGNNNETNTFFTYEDANNYLRVSEFIGMVNKIKQIIINKLVDMGSQCQNMNGLEYDKLSENQITLSCHNDVAQIEEQIVLAITKYIIGYIQNKFKININPYQIIGDLMVHLNLLEAVVYPLMYSTLYTINGVQYVTPGKIKETVNNIDIKNVLYTTLSKRGIICIPDSDDHV